MIASTHAGWRHGLLAFLLVASTSAYAADPEEEIEAQTQAQQDVVPPPPAPPAPPVQATPPAGNAASATPPPTKVNGNEVLLNFQAADIQAVVKAISQMTNRNFLLDPRVKGQVTIISAKPVPRSAAYQIFLSALKAQGFTAVEGPSGLVRVIPLAEAKQGANVTKDLPRGGEQMTTHVAILQNVSATQVVPVIRPLMAPTSQLSAYDPANALILTDYADNIRRMLAIIDKIDQPAASEVTVVPLKHASALDIADLITRLSVPPGATPGLPPGVPAAAPGMTPATDRFTIIPDLRTNSLLIRTENPARLAQLQSLISKLDVEATTGGQTRVIYLRNAEATKLAEVLRGLLAGEARAQQAAAPAAAGAPAAARPAGGRSAAEASLIQADEATNALIINASDAVYNNLRGVIEKLDVRRAQVFVEALIAEVSTEKASELGFQWAAAGDASNGAVAGITNFPNSAGQAGIIATAINPGVALAGTRGLSLAYLGRSITLPDGRQVRSIGALARALEALTEANILSTPNLLTLDNAEAKIVVGQNVPFVTGSFTGTGTGTTNGVNPFQTIERRDIGIQLRIKPQISEGGGVKLDIFQEISTVTPPPPGVTASDIITNKRSVETKVLVDDGATIVLGGLIEDNISDSRAQVPLLGRIPLLGALFRNKESTKRKTNLMIFLKPTILRTPEDSYRIATDRYEYIRLQSADTERQRTQQLDRFRPVPPPAPEPKEKESEQTKPALPSSRDPLDPAG